MGFFDLFLNQNEQHSFKRELRNVLGFRPDKLTLYKTALTHRSVRESAEDNNERLEYLGDAILSSIVADFLFRKYPYKEEGFLTEMRSKMVNRNKLNEIALKMGLKKITQYNKIDHSLKVSQIFGNTLEAVVGAVYLDKGFVKTRQWVLDTIVMPHLLMEDLENLEINHKNKLYGWANKNGKNLEFETLDERLEGGRRLFTVAAVVDGKFLAQGKAYNKKDASQLAAAQALENMGLDKAPEPESPTPNE
jgi:ribonuclease-3